MKTTEIFCEIDDFCHLCMPEWEKCLISLGYKQRRRKYRMTSREIMTITVFSYVWILNVFNVFIKHMSLSTKRLSITC